MRHNYVSKPICVIFITAYNTYRTEALSGFHWVDDLSTPTVVPLGSPRCLIGSTYKKTKSVYEHFTGRMNLGLAIPVRCRRIYTSSVRNFFQCVLCYFSSSSVFTRLNTFSLFRPLMTLVYLTIVSELYRTLDQLVYVCYSAYTDTSAV